MKDRFIRPDLTEDVWDVRSIPKGAILRDWMDKSIRVLLMRGPASINVYLGVPATHPLAGHSYDDLPVECHGGLTFSGNSQYFPDGYYWYGYDYAHADDAMLFADPKAADILGIHDGDKRWTIGEIVKETWSPIADLKRLMRLAERIANAAKTPA